MGCCIEEGGDPLFCERRAAGKWHCKAAEECLAMVEKLWNEGELEENAK